MEAPAQYFARETQSGALPVFACETTSTSRFIKLNDAAKPLKESAKRFAMVYDRKLGLIWPNQDVSSDRLSWKDGKAACAEFQLCGFSDWDMPERFELESILDLTRFNPAVDPVFFKSIKPSWYWSKTPYAADPAVYAWFVYFSYGDVYDGSQSYTGFVRAVRRVAASQSSSL